MNQESSLSIYDLSEKIIFIFIKIEIFLFILLAMIYAIASTLLTIPSEDLTFLVSAIVEPVFIFLYIQYSYKNLWSSEMIMVKRKMTLTSFFLLLFIVFSVDKCSGIIFGNNLIYNLSAPIENLNLPFWFFLLISTPIFEELLYRGIVLHLLKPHGKVFAIIISSILFSLLHGELVQGIRGLFFGIILGYICMEYSLKWSIFFHMLINGGYLITGFLFALPIDINLLYLILMIIGIIALILNLKNIKRYMDENPSIKGSYKEFFSRIWVIILVVLCFLNMIINTINTAFIK